LLIGSVIGTVWATRKDEKLTGLKLLLVRHVELDYSMKKSYAVAADSVGAGVGETVYYIIAYETVISLEKKPVLSDTSIVGIVDRIELKE
jgi:ethanolamine utilization protein EutN